MATYKIRKLDTDPLSGKPAAIAILYKVIGRKTTYVVNAPCFKNASQRDTWVAWAIKRYNVR